MATRNILDDQQHARQFKSRLFIFFWLALFFIVLVRFVHIQIIQGGYYSRLSLENMMRLKINKAPRGAIYDRSGVMLARERPSYAVSLLYHKVENRKKLMETLLQITDSGGDTVFNRRDLRDQFWRARRRSFEPIKLADDVPLDVVTVVEEHITDLPGIIVENESRREYPFGTLACHALGYMGEIPENDFDSMRTNFDYQYGDQIGVFGLEKQYEAGYLRGVDGKEYVMVNAFGREIKVIEGMPSRKVQKGRDIYLTIDYSLQKVAEEAFPDTLCGAVVAINPENGEILAMLSSPRFDPNIFTQSSKNRSRHWRRLLFDPQKPLNNRATTGLYPPGSTFKLVTAAAALNENIIDPHETFKPCFGSFQFGSRAYKCWQPKGHGALTLVPGVQKSCDVYFYQVGLKTGIEYIAQYAHMFGFGQKTEVDLPEESAGEVLDERTYNEKFKDRGWIWTKGQILNSSIGQGQVVSPIQLANYPGALVKETVLFKPHLFLYSPLAKGGSEQWKPDTLGRIDLKDETRAVLIQALRAVVEPGGTGGYARVDSVDIGGKTGTAQNPQGNDHALFFALGPLNKPTIAVAVVVENAGHGGSVAAPIAGKILRTYFNRPGR